MNFNIIVVVIITLDSHYFMIKSKYTQSFISILHPLTKSQKHLGI